MVVPTERYMEPEIIIKRMVGECSSSVTDSIDTPMLLVVLFSTTSNIGVSLISLHHTPRPHTLNRVIRNLMRLAHI